MFCIMWLILSCFGPVCYKFMNMNIPFSSMFMNYKIFLTSVFFLLHVYLLYIIFCLFGRSCTVMWPFFLCYMCEFMKINGLFYFLYFFILQRVKMLVQSIENLASCLWFINCGSDVRLFVLWISWPDCIDECMHWMWNLKILFLYLSSHGMISHVMSMVIHN